MRLFIVLILIILFTKNSLSNEIKDIFFIGKMDSYNKNFTLYFKTRDRAILARGENYNYISIYIYIY